MELLVSDISKGDDENVASCLRIAIEVIQMLFLFDSLNDFNFFSADGLSVLEISYQEPKQRRKQKLIEFVFDTMAIFLLR